MSLEKTVDGQGITAKASNNFSLGLTNLFELFVNASEEVDSDPHDLLHHLKDPLQTGVCDFFPNLIRERLVALCKRFPDFHLPQIMHEQTKSHYCKQGLDPIDPLQEDLIKPQRRILHHPKASLDIGISSEIKLNQFFRMKLFLIQKIRGNDELAFSVLDSFDEFLISIKRNINSMTLDSAWPLAASFFKVPKNIKVDDMMRMTFLKPFKFKINF